jgi:mRNA interferase RelE/StbE
VKVAFRSSFVEDLKDVKDRALLKRIKAAIETAEKAGSLSELSSLKRLKSNKCYFRVRVSNYRIGLTLEQDTLIFVRFLNRKDIYKHFP